MVTVPFCKLVEAALDGALLAARAFELIAFESALAVADALGHAVATQRLGKLSVGTDVRTWTRRVTSELALDHLPVTAEHTAAVEHLPDVHRDPFDRLLVAQAVAEGAVLLTSDDRLTEYGDAVRLVG